MEQLLNEIKIPYLDTEINRLIAAIPDSVGGAVPAARYNQHEDLFVLLDSDFMVPRLPVHHDMNVSEPEDAYIGPVRDLVKRLIERIPAAFQGLTYYFDPVETFKLPFFRLYKIEESVYIYLLRVDISCHSLDAEIIEPGHGNSSAVYRSSRLFAESILLPLDSVSWEEGRVKGYKIRQLLSNTYMGEVGHSYFGKLGIWKDTALTKFFSKLVLPEGAKTYPFFPLSCKYRTVCAEVPFLGPHFRKKALPLLHRAISFLSPEMVKIENSLKSGEFSHKMPLFAELRGRIPSAWKDTFQGYSSRPYLNERDMKEFALEVPIAELSDLNGLKVTVMGLGLNGGLASAGFFARQGAIVTVTDMKDEKALAASIEALGDLPIRYVLGRHEMADFEGADLVIKNPAVRPDSPFLRAAKSLETDISVFLRLSKAPIVAVTGSKGKSTVSSALHHGFMAAGTKAFLGGNITVSPLSFLPDTRADTPVVLELSSWQLADLKGMGVLKPSLALLTAMMPDHMNRYGSMEEYMADKRLIYADQGPKEWLVANHDDEWNRSFAEEARAGVAWYADSPQPGQACAWLEGGRGLFSLTGRRDEAEEVLPERLLVPGGHQRKNLLGVALALRLYGLEAEAISRGLGSFRGVEHRLEHFAAKDGVDWYNDSAATIPQAVAAALGSFECPVVLITGGTDKNLDFLPVRAAYRKPKAIILLAGSGTDKLRPLLEEDGIAYQGPFSDLDSALKATLSVATKGDTVLLSPGCTSFGMFVHEFDRGNKFKESVRELLGLKA